MRLASTVRTYRTVLANRSLRRALIAFFLFNAEENAIWIAVTLFAYGEGGATAAGIVSIVQLVPAAVVAPLGSVIGDRMRRDRALALGYLCQAMSALACGLALSLGPPILVYLTAVVSACAITLTRPVHNALLPDLAEDTSELTASNSVSSSSEAMGIMVGPLVTSLMVATSGLASVMYLFAALMLIAVGLTARLALHEPSDADRSDHEQGVVAAAMEGARALGHDRPAAAVTLFGGAQFLILGILDVLYLVLAIGVLDLGGEGAGFLAAAVGVGGLLGAATTAILVGRIRLASPILVAVGVGGTATAMLALVGAIGGAILLLAVAGAARAFFDVAARTLLQRSVRADILSRVFGLQEAMLMVGSAIGAGLAPVLVALFGERGAFVAAGILLPACGFAVLPALRLLDRRALVPDPGRLALFHGLDIFRPVPQPTLERLVAIATPMHVVPGQVFIREGDVGDRVYVVEHGEIEVEHAGQVVATHTRGSYVGEIALLRDVPRTATVRALTDAQLLAVDRDPFLDAVTGSRRSTRRMDTEVDRRLSELDEMRDPSSDRNDPA